MSLKIVSNAVDLSAPLRAAIAAVLPDAEIAVRLTSPGHYEIEVCAEAFRGKSLVQQQQMVYGSILSFMSGDDAPVHAIDRMQTRTP
ncbi:MAG: BolA/IbaG family iron-sulfur metabolism protein [Deltaproteobacteria bacterium]|nr:MAG: BolA/IbaG family iron-sulfur metabolism protein [Deltaproteobacteria bacterium]